MRRLIVISLLILLAVPRTWSQQYNFRKFSIEHGLPRSSVYAITEDNDGYLWIGVDGGGVARFDGYNFSSLDIKDGLPSHYVRAVFQDSRGLMWFGTTDGLCSYDFHEITVYDESDGLIDNYIRSIEEDSQGRIWVGTDGGISIIDTETGKIDSLTREDGILHNKVRCLLRDSKGHMWIGSNDGISVHDGHHFHHYNMDSGMSNNTVLELFEDSRGTMWAGTKYGVNKFTKEGIKFFTSMDGLVHNRVRAIAQDEDGNMWFGTRKGLSKFNGRNFITYSIDEGLSHNRIRDILLDSWGNLWFGTYFGGINKYRQGDFILYTMTDGLVSDQVFSIHEDEKGHMLLGTFDGVTKMRHKDVHQFETQSITEQDRLIFPHVSVVYKDSSGYYWYGTTSGITLMSKTDTFNITVLQGMAGDETHAIYEKDRNNFWVGTNEGVSHIHFYGEKDSFDIKNYNIYEHPDMAGSQVTTIAEDNIGRLWLGFRDGSISIMDDGKISKIKLPENVYDVVTLLNGPNNTMWIGTDGNGIFRVSPRNDGSFHVINYTMKDGLSSNNIYNLVFDKSWHLWAGSQRGVDHILFGGRAEISSVKHFGREEGFIGIETNENAAYRDHDGQLWFGTINGVAFYDNASTRKNLEEVKLHISHVHLYDEHIHWNESEYAEGVTDRFGIPKKLRLPYDQNSLSFIYVGINHSAPHKVKYKYMLEGFDDDWSEPTSRREISFTNLSPGRYTFKVIAANEDGLWNEEPTTFTFVIEAPFWQTTWFYILVGIVGMILIYVISQARVKRLQRAKMKLEGMVKERTSELEREKELVEAKNVEISKHQEELQEAHTNITDSINYAKRIQSAVMRTETAEGESSLKERMFVFYRPKDIVSGDFYWYTDKENCSYFTAADCTGHGVPGAFMSMIGITYLNQIIGKRGVPSPDAILDALRKNIIKALRTDSGDQTKDGMDMSLCKMDWNNNVLEYAGANNSMYLIREEKLEEYKPNKMPIGEHDLSSEKFTNHKVEVKQGDMIYLFSDGFADQFGGPKGKKYMYGKFKKFLVRISGQSIDKQEELLEREIEDWMEGIEQIDDILVIGVRV